MIEISVRDGFEGTVFFGPLQCRIDGYAATFDEVLAAITDRRVLMMIHGYNSEFKGAQASYATIEQKLLEHGMIPANYEKLIGFYWPGSFIGIAFWPAVKRATKTGRMLADFGAKIQAAARLFHIETHSLGARVALEARREAGRLCERMILTAPAVDAECLEPGEEFAPGAADLTIAYSRNDEVLHRWFEISEFEKALGYEGPHDPVLAAAQLCDASALVPEHSAYRSCDSFYRYWQRACAGAVAKAEVLS